uniref:Uncharacterized protein n=1 Tax=Glossina palpalis gambiensis TaxID=67801 RepID=A0A1B0BF82_9MUSC
MKCYVMEYIQQLREPRMRINKYFIIFTRNTVAHDNGSDHVLIVTYHVVIIRCSLNRNSCLLSLYNMSGVMYAIPSNMAWALSLPFQLLAIESNTKWRKLFGRHMPLERLSPPCSGIQHN